MPSRKQRKRNRRTLAEATAAAPQLAGGWGQGAPVSRSDLLLVRQTIREGWRVPQDVYEAVVRDVVAIAIDPDVETRMYIAAARTLIKMASENQRQM